MNEPNTPPADKHAAPAQNEPDGAGTHPEETSAHVKAEGSEATLPEWPEPHTPSPAASSEPHTHAPVPPIRRERREIALPVLGALGFLLLAAGGGYLWNENQQLREMVAGNDSGRVAALEGQVTELRQRVEQLAQRPAADAPDLKPLESRLAALEQKQAELANHPAAPPPDLGPLTSRLDTIAGKQEQIAGQAQSAEAALQDRLSALEQRLQQTEQQATGAADRAARADRLQAARVALDAGQPLGNIPSAPEALARFATVGPPTEAQLRLSFPDAARRAEAASAPNLSEKPLGERMWLRAQSLVTVRQGDKVLVGAPAATVLGRARERLDAGDLAGAVQALDGLDASAAVAMADWRARAQEVLDARAALTQMARG
jgi:hypothetical protein